MEFPQVLASNNRGGASKASVATFTNHVAGNRAISYMVVYPSYTTCVNTRACANGAEIAIFEIIFYRERKLWEKKTGVGSNLGLMHCRPLHLPPSQWGSGSFGLQIWLLYC